MSDSESNSMDEDNINNPYRCCLCDKLFCKSVYDRHIKTKTTCIPKDELMALMKKNDDLIRDQQQKLCDKDDELLDEEAKYKRLLKRTDKYKTECDYYRNEHNKEIETLRKEKIERDDKIRKLTEQIELFKSKLNVDELTMENETLKRKTSDLENRLSNIKNSNAITDNTGVIIENPNVLTENLFENQRWGGERFRDTGNGYISLTLANLLFDHNDFASYLLSKMEINASMHLFNYYLFNSNKDQGLYLSTNGDWIRDANFEHLKQITKKTLYDKMKPIYKERAKRYFETSHYSDVYDRLVTAWKTLGGFYNNKYVSPENEFYRVLKKRLPKLDKQHEVFVRSCKFKFQ